VQARSTLESLYGDASAELRERKSQENKNHSWVTRTRCHIFVPHLLVLGLVYFNNWTGDTFEKSDFTKSGTPRQDFHERLLFELADSIHSSSH